MELFAEAGTTYYVLAIDVQYDGGGNGGPPSISFEETPPPPTLDISVDPFGTVNIQTGVATISGAPSAGPLYAPFDTGARRRS